MNLKRHPILLALAICLCSILLFNLLPRLSLNISSILQTPQQHPEPIKNFDYYIIIDEMDGRSLMYVPLIVSIGDEVVTEENKRYKIVKIEQNRAFAKYIEDVNLEQYKKK